MGRGSGGGGRSGGGGGGYSSLAGKSVTVPGDITGRQSPQGWNSRVSTSKWEKYGKSRLYINYAVYDKRWGRRRSGDLGYIDLQTNEIKQRGQGGIAVRKAISALQRG